MRSIRRVDEWRRKRRDAVFVPLGVSLLMILDQLSDGLMLTDRASRCRIHSRSLSLGSPTDLRGRDGRRGTCGVGFLVAQHKSRFLIFSSWKAQGRWIVHIDRKSREEHAFWG